MGELARALARRRAQLALDERKRAVGTRLAWKAKVEG